MLGRLIKWVVQMIIIGTIGTLCGWALQVAIAETPLWELVIALMVVAVLLFKFAVWAIGQSDYV